MTNATELGLVGCNFCGRANTPEHKRCERCHHRLEPVSRSSLQQTWAWLLTSIVLYIPANVYPMMATGWLGHEHGHTIMEGVMIFYDEKDYFVGSVILIASVLIPSSKLLSITYIALTVQFDWKASREKRVLMYEVIEFIGRWSMIDVFVVTLMVALIQFGGVVEVSAGPASICFALSVILAMIAAQKFDTKLIWLDAHEGEAENG